MNDTRCERGPKSPPLPEGVIWPTFDDGQPVMFGDEIEGFDGKVCNVSFCRDSVHIGTDSFWLWRSEKDEPPKRRKPDVLDADGVPILIGDTVYGEDGRAWTVQGYVRGSEHSVWANDGGKRRDLRPEWLTHRKPDSLEAVRDDATMPSGVYCVKFGLVESGEDVDQATLVERHILDLLARQRRLMGGE